MDANIFCILIFTFYLNCCDCVKKYDHYTLFRGVPIEKAHLEFLETITEKYDANYWRPPGLLLRPVDFIISPQDKMRFLRDSESIGLYLTTVIDDVQKAFERQTVKTYIRRKMESYDWNHFFRLKDINQWLADLAKQYPAEMSVFSIGFTHENRNIMGVRISLKGSLQRSKVIIEGGIHAREWISPAFVTYMINEILRAPQRNDTKLLTIAKTYEWYFVPVLNPDGYEFSHTEDRLWRKNRHDGNGGVDLNRNFNHSFGTVGVSYTKTSETYCGPSAFSERESSAMAKFISARSSQLEYYLAFHSYGQYMIIPYADKKVHMDNYDEVKSMCLQARSKISTRYNTHYMVGTAYDTVGYVTSGVSGCWVKSTFKIPYVVTFELRDKGYDGFALPPEKIEPTCKETMDGLISLLTPRTKSFKKLRESLNASELNGQPYNILDKIVIVFNAFLFIIVRFDYECFLLPNS